MEISEIILPEQMKHEWNKHTVLHLIELWRQNECLYDTNNSFYHNKHARMEALDNMAIMLSDDMPGITPMGVKTKITYLRSQYGREISKMQNKMKNGTGTDDLYAPTAYWFEHMDFLQNFLTVGKGKSNSFCNFENTSSEADDYGPSISKCRKIDRNSPAIENKNEEHVMPESILRSCNDVLIKLSARETSDDMTVDFFRSQLKEITDSDLKDEVTTKIILLLFEYKKKNRNLKASNNK